MKRFVVASGILALMVLSGGEAWAQTGGARGKVVDEQGQPIVDAKVLIEFEGGMTRKFEGKTDKKGEFIQIGLPPGIYRFTATKEGLRSDSTEEKVSLGEPTSVHELKLVKATAPTAGPKSELAAQFSAAAGLLREGKLDEAEAGFKAILAKTPAIPEAHFNLGVIASKRKDFPSAQAEFQQAVDMRPTYVDAWSALAHAYQDGGDKDKAIETMKEASSQNEGDASVQLSLAIFYVNSQRLDDADAALKKVEAIEPTNPELLYYQGTIALSKGDTAGCLARLEKYLAASPKNATNIATAKDLIAALKAK